MKRILLAFSTLFISLTIIASPPVLPVESLYRSGNPDVCDFRLFRVPGHCDLLIEYTQIANRTCPDAGVVECFSGIGSNHYSWSAKEGGIRERIEVLRGDLLWLTTEVQIGQGNWREQRRALYSPFYFLGH